MDGNSKLGLGDGYHGNEEMLDLAMDQADAQPPEYSPLMYNQYDMARDHGYPPQPSFSPVPQHVHNTTVVVQQPSHVHEGPPRVMPQNIRPWGSGLCDCCDDMSTCLCGTFCPCILWCRVAGRLDENPCTLCCVPGAPINLRTKIRTMTGIQGSMCNDCMAVECCGPCAVCQMVRELKEVGITH